MVGERESEEIHTYNAELGGRYSPKRRIDS